MLLRAPRLDDAEAVFEAYASDPEVTRFMPWSAHADVAATRAYLRERIEGTADGTHAYWVLTSGGGVPDGGGVLTSGGGLIEPGGSAPRPPAPALPGLGGVLGIIGLRFEGTEAEVGFVVARPFWNRGYATEALQAVLERARGGGFLRRVWGFCDLENVGSARVMEKAGMARERVEPRFAVFSGFPEPRDAVIYGITFEAGGEPSRPGSAG